MTDENEELETISYAAALEARDAVAPIPTHIDAFMAQNGWTPMDDFAGYSRPKKTRPDFRFPVISGVETGQHRFTLEEREEMQRIGGTAGYLKVCADRLRESKPELFEGNRTLWCLSCGHAHDVTPVGTPTERCVGCGAGGDKWWTRNQLRGSEAHARMLKAGCVGCDVCGEFRCTKNHPEFT